MINEDSQCFYSPSMKIYPGTCKFRPYCSGLNCITIVHLVAPLQICLPFSTISSSSCKKYKLILLYSSEIHTADSCWATNTFQFRSWCSKKRQFHIGDRCTFQQVSRACIYSACTPLLQPEKLKQDPVHGRIRLIRSLPDDIDSTVGQ